MVVLATNDHKGGEVTVGPQHGGCGQTHRYVISPAGYPQVDCPVCEDFLRKDSQHATVPSKVPMTYDEKLIKEDLESRSNARQQVIQAIASARIAGMDAEADMLAAMAGITLPAAGIALPAKPHVPQTVNCPAGHPNPPGQKFCGECAAPVLPAGETTVAWPLDLPPGAAQSAPGPPAEPAPAPKDPEPPAPVSAPPGPPWPSNTAMRKMGKDELAAVAGKHGVDAAGTRAGLLGRLIEAANAAR